jgi:hypothetical protein
MKFFFETGGGDFFLILWVLYLKCVMLKGFFENSQVYFFNIY